MAEGKNAVSFVLIEIGFCFSSIELIHAKRNVLLKKMYLIWKIFSILYLNANHIQKCVYILIKNKIDL